MPLKFIEKLYLHPKRALGVLFTSATPNDSLNSPLAVHFIYLSADICMSECLLTIGMASHRQSGGPQHL